MPRYAGWTVVVLVVAILTGFLWRESSRTHSCGTISLEASFPSKDFDSHFPQYLAEFYSSMTESDVHLVSGNSQHKFSMTSPMGVFDCTEQPTGAYRHYRFQCFAYGYLSLSKNSFFRFVFVHKDDIAVEYSDGEQRMELSLNMTFNTVFDLMLTTDEACTKFQKDNKAMARWYVLFRYHQGNYSYCT